MASTLDKDPYTYQKERDTFLKELWQFHQSRGTAYTRIPSIGGKEVDLYLLYSKVNDLGGWDKVTDYEIWEDIVDFFNIPRACTNASHALKHIYLRYLFVFYKVNKGDDPDLRPYDADDAESGRKRQKLPHIGVPMRYNVRQHIVSDSMRVAAGLSTNYITPHDYVKLEKALLSGMPNEVDFAINVCTLLSNEGRRTLIIDKCPNLVRILLAHVGLFEDGPGSLQKLYEDGWKCHTNRNFLRFWLDSVVDKQIRALVASSVFSVTKTEDGEVVAKGKKMEIVELDGGESTSDDTNSMSLGEILNLNRELGVHDVEGQRVLQMAMIIRNLSFEEDNLPVLASDLIVFRFLQLCINNKYNALKQLGLDTLGNVARKVTLDPIEYRTSQLFIRTITECIGSKDKFEITRGLEMLANLSHTEKNSGLLSNHLEQWVYNDIVNMLLVHDIQLIVSTLEALYQLSELGEATASHIANVKAAIGILIDLLTVEAQSYGPNSLIGIRVVEHVPPPSQQQRFTTVQQVPALQNLTASPHRSTVPSPQVARPPAPMPAPVSHTVQHALSPQRPSGQMTLVRQGTHHLVSPSPAQPPTLHLTSKTPSQAPHPEMDAEALARNWLLTHIDLCPTSVMTRAELYADYLATCGRLGIRNVINTNSFANCVRVSFPKVDTTRVEKEDNSVEIHYKGLRRKVVPLPFPSQQSGSVQGKGSLIQQQLASPLKSRKPPPPSLNMSQATVSQPPTSQHSPNYPTIHQALLQKAENEASPPPSQTQFPSSPGHHQHPVPPLQAQQRASNTTDTNLIKSLLANKVTANMQRVQQQQQQQVTVGMQQQQQYLQGQQSPCTSQQSPLNQVTVMGQQVVPSLQSNAMPPVGQHDHSAHQQQAVHLPQGLPVQNPASQQQPILPSASAQQQAVLPQPDGSSTAQLQQPPSPRSKLKMTLVAKSAVISAGQKQGSLSMDSNTHNSTEEQLHAGNLSSSNQNSDTLKSKPNQIEACMERVQNTFSPKVEAPAMNQTDKPKMEVVKTELVNNSAQHGLKEKTNGVGSNGTTVKLESQSDINNMNAGAQMFNGNTDKPLEHTKSLLSDSDKLLTQEEIDRKKQEEVLQLLERNKDQVIAMNGVVNHVGNGDCMLPGGIYAKGQIPGKDGKSLGQNLNTDLVKSKAPIIENGFASPERNFNEENKSLRNIPGTVGRSVVGSQPQLNSSTCTVINQTVDVSQDGQNKTLQDTLAKAKDLQLSSNDGRGVPMDVDTAEMNTVDGGSKSGNLISATPSSTSQSTEDPQGKSLGTLTIAEMLKQRKGPDSAAPGSQNATTTSAVAGVPTSLSSTYPMGIPAAGYAATLPAASTTVAAAYNMTRPAALLTSAETNPQLAKVSGSIATANVHSPTLANLPLPGDLASQVNNIMQSSKQQQQQQQQQLPTQAVVGGQNALTPQQQSAIIQQLSQPSQQQPANNSGTQFAAHMQQLQQRLQMPPQVSWPPAVSQQQQQQQQQQQVTPAPQIPVSAAMSQQQTNNAVAVQPQVLPHAVGHVQQQAQPQTVPQLQQQQSQLPVQPSVKSQLVQRLQQPLAPSPQLTAQQPQQQLNPPLMQQQTASNQLAPQHQQPILLQAQQQSVNGQVHQVVIPASQNQIQAQTIQRPQGQPVVIQGQNPVQVVSSQHGQPVQVVSNQGQTVQMVTGQGQVQVVSGQGPTLQVVGSQGQPIQVMASQGQPIQVMSSQGQPIQVMSSQGQAVQVVSSQGQQVQVVSTSGQPIQVVNSQGQSIQVLQGGQGPQVQVVAGGQGQQLIQGQQVQVVQGGIQMRGQQVQVMPGQCVQMQVQGQSQVMQLQMQQGTQMMQGQFVIQAPAGGQQQTTAPQQRPVQLVPNNQAQLQVGPGQMLLPKPQPTQMLLSSSSAVSGINQVAIQAESQISSHPQSQLQAPQIRMTTQVQQQSRPTQPQQASQPQITPQPVKQQLHVQTQGSTTPAAQPAASQSPGEAALSPGGTKRPATSPQKTDGQPAKKGRLGTEAQKTQSAQPLKSTTPAAIEYMCEWAGCKQCFDNAKLVAAHVVKTHYTSSLDSGFCRWENCDKLKRQKWSLITHIQDRHLSEAALRAAHVKRQQAASRAPPTTCSSGPAATAAVPPVYPPDAAAQAIRRFAPRQPYPDFVKQQQQQQGASGQHQQQVQQQQQHPHPPHQQPPQPHQHRLLRPNHPPIPPFEEAKEGPVTKHIRLTSALILRNIAKYSESGRRMLSRHEQHLSYIALSSVEASTAVAHCLWELKRHLEDPTRDMH